MGEIHFNPTPGNTDPLEIKDPLFFIDHTSDQMDEITINQWYGATQTQLLHSKHVMYENIRTAPDFYKGASQAHIKTFATLFSQYVNLYDEYLSSQYNRDNINQAASDMQAPADALTSALDSYNNKVDELNQSQPWNAYNDAVTAFQQAIANGDDYATAAQAFNAAVDAYNLAIQPLNNKAAELDQPIADYNTALDAYNQEVDIANTQIDAANIDRVANGLDPLPHIASLTPLTNTAVTLPPQPTVSIITPPDPLPQPLTITTLEASDIDAFVPPQVSSDIKKFTGGVLKNANSLGDTIDALATAIDSILRRSPTFVKLLYIDWPTLAPEFTNITTMVLGLGNPQLMYNLTRNQFAQYLDGVFGRSTSLQPFPEDNLIRLVGGSLTEVSLLGTLDGTGVTAHLKQPSNEDIQKALSLGTLKQIQEYISSGDLRSALSKFINDNYPNGTDAQKGEAVNFLEASIALRLLGVGVAQLGEAAGNREGYLQQAFPSFTNGQRGNAQTSTSPNVSQPNLSQPNVTTSSPSSSQGNNTITTTTVTSSGVKVNQSRNSSSPEFQAAKAAQEAYFEQAREQYFESDKLALEAARQNQIRSDQVRLDSTQQTSAQRGADQSIAQNQINSSILNSQIESSAIEKQNIENSNLQSSLQAQRNREFAILFEESHNVLRNELKGAVTESSRQSLTQNVVQPELITRPQADVLSKPLNNLLSKYFGSQNFDNIDLLSDNIAAQFEKAGISPDQATLLAQRYLDGFVTNLAIQAGLPAPASISPKDQSLNIHISQALENTRTIANNVVQNFNTVRDQQVLEQSINSFIEFLSLAQQPSQALTSFLDPGVIVSKIGIMYEGMEHGFKRGGAELV